MGGESDVTVILLSKEDVEFTVPLNVAKMSELVSSMVEEAEEEDDDDDDDDDTNDDDGSGGGRKRRIVKVPLLNVSTPILQKVIEFCTYYQEVEPMRYIEKGPLRSTELSNIIQPWYANFVKEEEDDNDEQQQQQQNGGNGNGISKEELFELLLAANYMNIETLLNLTGPAIAGRIMGMSTEEMRTFFHITNDFTPEEEAEVRESFKWCEATE